MATPDFASQLRQCGVLHSWAKHPVKVEAEDPKEAKPTLVATWLPEKSPRHRAFPKHTRTEPKRCRRPGYPCGTRPFCDCTLSEGTQKASAFAT